jgi:lipopolysaccharide export system protein LptC
MAWTVDWRKVRLGQRLQAFLPVFLLGTLALFTYWLVQNSPILSEQAGEAKPSAKPNAYFHRFRLIGLGPSGDWDLQLTGARAMHRADIERYDIEEPQLFKRDAQTGVQTEGRAQKGQVNESGTQVQLFGNAIIHRPAYKGVDGTMNKAFEIRSDYLLLDDHRHAVETNRPVTLTQGQDRFSAERMLALQKEGKLELDGRVRGTLVPPPQTPAGKDQ